MYIYYTNNFTGARADSHKLLEHAIAMHGNSDTAAELISEISRGEHGKPYIRGWKHFSISHSETSWAVLIADEECGLDIQFERKIDELKLAARWYHPDEVSALVELEQGELTHEFFRIWTRREAMGKAAGTGIMSASLPSTLGDEVDYEGVTWQLKDVEIPGIDHAVVCAKTIDEIRIIEL